MSGYAVETKDITKKFGPLTAVDGINITVGNGEFFGFLGPNGAGKSTLIRMLTTVLRPTSGTAIVAGYDITKDPGEVRRAIGVVPQSMSSDLDLTGAENMDIYGRLYEVPGRIRRERTKELLERVGLTNKARELVATYSGGMRRRLDIARVLVHRPELLFLDEPTSGLDPQSRRVVWDMLQGMAKDYGLTVFLTTHYMDEAEELCGRVAIIDYGKIVTLGTPDELKSELQGNDVVVLTVTGDGEKARALAEAQPFVSKATLERNELRCTVENGGQDAAPLMRVMEENGVKVGEVSIKRL